MKPAALIIAAAALATTLGRAADVSTLFAERVKSTVAVEYVVESENERRTTLAYGVAIDTQGTIILPAEAIDVRLSPGQLKDFKVYEPGNPVPYKGEYLGQDVFTGWHFVRAEERLRSRLVPITAFAAHGRSPEPKIAEELWGIGIRPKDEDFMPYFFSSHLSLSQSLPEKVGILQQEVAGPGLPVFNSDGVFVGLALHSFGETYMQYSQADRDGEAIMLVDVEESSVFEYAEEILPYLSRIPKNVDGRPLAWLGAYGLEPLDRDVAAVLHLSDQSGVVVSEVLENSPAEKAGMKARDIIIAIDGRPIPHFRPDRVASDFVEREIERREPGQTMDLTVLRGSDRIEITAVLGDEPKLVREAARRYFDRLGFTAREFVYGDAVARRIPVADAGGVVVHYIKPNSPAAIAGLQIDDWIKEIDGVQVRSFAEATVRLAAIESDPARSEFVLLVARGGDTSILRVKLR
jgi:serine protease Do